MSEPYYPKTILEFAARFHNDETCTEYLIQNRWPNGLDEFVFRFNRHEHPMAAFLSLLGIVVSKHSFTHNDLTKP